MWQMNYREIQVTRQNPECHANLMTQQFQSFFGQLSFLFLSFNLIPLRYAFLLLLLLEVDE